MNFIGARALLEMQTGDPRKLIRGARRPLFFPWRPTKPSQPTSKALFISTASDLYWWRKEDRELLEQLLAPVRLVRPGSMTQAQMVALKGAETIYVDVWCGDEAVRHQLLEVLLPQVEPINKFVM